MKVTNYFLIGFEDWSKAHGGEVVGPSKELTTVVLPLLSLLLSISRHRLVLVSALVKEVSLEPVMCKAKTYN